MAERIRVLIIDDDQMFRSLLTSILRKDFLVSVAASGEEGFAKAREHRPDVAVIDVQMPGWSGIDTLRMFHKDPSLAIVKTIMLTGDASKETVLAAVHSGADDYVIKSCFNKTEFVNKVRRQVYGVEEQEYVSEPAVAVAAVTPQPAHFSSPKDAQPKAVVESVPVNPGVVNTATLDQVQMFMDNWD